MRAPLPLLLLALAACTGNASSGSTGSTSGSGTSGSGTTGGSSGGSSSGGTSAGGSASFSGVHGFTAVSAVGSIATFPDGGVRSVSVVALNEPDSCARTGNPPAPYFGLKLEVDSAGAMVPGVAQLNPASDPHASANTFSSDAGVRHVGNNYLVVALGGSVTLTGFDRTHITGSVDLQMELGDGGTTPLTGSFDAVTCP